MINLLESGDLCEVKGIVGIKEDIGINENIDCFKYLNKYILNEKENLLYIERN